MNPFLSRAAFDALAHCAAFIADPRNFTDDQVLLDEGRPYDHVDLLLWSCRQVGLPAAEVPVVLAAHGYLRDARGRYRHVRRWRGRLQQPAPGSAAAMALALGQQIERTVEREIAAGRHPHLRFAS